MKKGNIKYMSVVVVLFVATMAVSCNKEFSLNGLRVKVENYQTDGKTAVSGVNIHWMNNDPIRVNGVECHVAVDGTNVAVTDGDRVDVSGGIYAYSPFNMTVTNDQTTTPTVTFPSRFLSSFDGDRQIIDLPMVAYATSDATTITFKHISSAVLVRVKNSTNNVLYIDSVILDAYYQICGQKTLNLTNSELGLGSLPTAQGTSDQKVITVYFAENSVSLAPNEIKDIQVPVLPYRGGNTTIQVYSHNAVTGATIPVQPHTFSLRSAMPSLNRNHLCTAQIQIKPYVTANPSDHVHSKAIFQIGSDKFVYFSQGNLVYTGTESNPHWNFATNQYDALFEAGNMPASSGSNDVFGWASNNYDNGQGNGYKARQTSADNSIYQLGGSTGNIYDIPTADWGYFPIENGGNVGGFWRTLTSDEWNYLLNQRSYSSSRKGLARVNGVNGLVLLPNGDWTMPDGLSFTSGTSAYNQNVYSASEWIQMESAGAVFLPAAGYRYGGSYSENNAGEYWSSTRHDENRGKCVYFKAGQLQITNFDLSRGQSVRLVRDAN